MDRTEIRNLISGASVRFSDARCKAKTVDELGEALKRSYAEFDEILKVVSKDKFSFSDSRFMFHQLNQFRQHLNQYAKDYALFQLGIETFTRCDGLAINNEFEDRNER